MNDLAPRFAPAATVLAVGAAWLVPGHRMGIGVVLVVGLLLGAVAAAVGNAMSVGRVGTFALALCLAASAAIRDATWMVIPGIALCFVLVAIAVRDARSFGGLASAIVAPLRLVSGARLALEGFKGRVRPDLYDRARPLIRGLVTGALLLAVFGGLFVTADRAFARYAEQIFTPYVDLALVPVRLLTAAVAVALAAALARRAEEPTVLPVEGRYPGSLDEAPERPLRPIIEWAIPLVLLVLLFTAFVAVQFAVLFGGNRHVLTTAGLTYAEYARAGFFQLLIVAALTVAVVGSARRLVPVERRAERYLLEGLETALCLLTLVVLASALYRLQVYEDAYGFTRARFTARGTMFWIGALLVVMIVRGWVGSFAPRLVTAVVALSVGSMFAVVMLNPDARIARGNVERFERTAMIDVSYLSTLSADAVPELLRLPEPHRSCALRNVPRETEPWAAANVARARARAALSSVSVPSGEVCWALDT